MAETDPSAQLTGLGREPEPDETEQLLAADEARRIRCDVDSFRPRLDPSVTPERLLALLRGETPSDG